jgi:hypothetical protein
MENIIDQLTKADKAAFQTPAVSVNPGPPVGSSKILCDIADIFHQRFEQCKMDSADNRPAWGNLLAEMETSINEQTPPYTRRLTRTYLVLVGILAKTERATHCVQREKIPGLENLTAPIA